MSGLVPREIVHLYVAIHCVAEETMAWTRLAWSEPWAGEHQQQ